MDGNMKKVNKSVEKAIELISKLKISVEERHKIIDALYASKKELQADEFGIDHLAKLEELEVKRQNPYAPLFEEYGYNFIIEFIDGSCLCFDYDDFADDHVIKKYSFLFDLVEDIMNDPSLFADSYAEIERLDREAMENIIEIIPNVRSFYVANIA